MGITNSIRKLTAFFGFLHPQTTIVFQSGGCGLELKNLSNAVMSEQKE